jgi:hypothetical protein
MPIRVTPVGRDEPAPLPMPDRFRHEVTYFMTPAGEPGVPHLGPGEYFVRLTDARKVLDDGCIELVSPLDSAMRAEVELSEDHERWLEWMIAHELEHIVLKS